MKLITKTVIVLWIAALISVTGAVAKVVNLPYTITAEERATLLPCGTNLLLPDEYSSGYVFTASNDYRVVDDSGFIEHPEVGGDQSYRKYVKDHCQWCERKTTDLEVHHIYQQSMWTNNHPDWGFSMNDPTNLATLCRIDHLRVGHMGDFQRCVTNFWKMLAEAKR